MLDKTFGNHWLLSFLIKEGNVLFNDIFNTFLFTVIWCQTFGKGTIQTARELTCCCHYIGYSFQLAARVLLYAPSHFVTPLMESTMNDQSDDIFHHDRMLLPWSYILLPQFLSVECLCLYWIQWCLCPADVWSVWDWFMSAPHCFILL